MSPLSSSVRFLWKAAILPVKLLVDTGELTFKAGLKIGGLPVKGSRVAVQAVGWKVTIGVVVGLVAGFLLGREVERRLHAMHHHDDVEGPDTIGVIEGAA